MAAAIPLVVSGVTSYLASRQSGPNDQQKGLLGSQVGQAGGLNSLSDYLRTQSQGQYNLSQPAYGKAVSYYSTLLNGNRAMQQQAIAPAAANIQDTYAGAERNLERLGVRGGEALTAKADLARQQAGQIGQLTAGVQPQAAQALGGLGNQGIYAALTGAQTAGSLGASAAGIYGNALNSATGIANTAYGRNTDIGSSFMSTVMPYLMQLLGSRAPQSGPPAVPNTFSPGTAY